MIQAMGRKRGSSVVYIQPWWKWGGLKFRLGSRWRNFSYNFGWPNYVGLFDGWVARCAMTVPILGYAILYNDTVVQHFEFTKLAGASASVLGISSVAKLKLTYFGLLLLGASNVIYRTFRPHVMRLGRDEYEYVKNGLEHFTISDYVAINDRIISKGHVSPHGNYGGNEFHELFEAATKQRTRMSGLNSDLVVVAPHWANAKAQHEGLLRSMLIENYARGKLSRKPLLAFNLSVALFGCVLLALPSLDLFLRVLHTLL